MNRVQELPKHGIWNSGIMEFRKFDSQNLLLTAFRQFTISAQIAITMARAL